MKTLHCGKVFLVGAGPGDPELLTLKAVRAIAQADVLLVDDLVNPLVLEHARRDARIVQVGKRGGCQSTPQQFIERLMVSESLAGNVVVRLKGGDPFMFGRGGEEIAALEAAGIEYEVLNGITAGLAGPTSVGIPLTHRDFCHGVAFITGHTKSEKNDAPATVTGSGAHAGYLYGNFQFIGNCQRAECPWHAPQHANRGDSRRDIAKSAGIDLHA